MILTLNVHFSRVSDLERPDYLTTNPSVLVKSYRDSFGNLCGRLVTPAGRFSLGTDGIIRDSRMPDMIELNALQHQVQHVPAEVVLFLLGSRYCETDRLSYRTRRGGSSEAHIRSAQERSSDRACSHCVRSRRRGRAFNAHLWSIYLFRIPHLGRRNAHLKYHHESPLQLTDANTAARSSPFFAVRNCQSRFMKYTIGAHAPLLLCYRLFPA